MLWIGLFGVLAAAALENPGAFWIGAFCGYLYHRLRQADHALALLRARVDAAQRLPVAAKPDTTVVPDPGVEVEAPEVVAASGASTVAEDAVWTRAEPSAVTPNAPPAAAASAAPSLLDRLLERARGGNPLARLGVLITFIGAVYLIRYAAEEGWLPIELRLGGLALAAFALVVTGWRLHRRADGAGESYGLTLQGGGFALLYLTVLAAFRLYALITPTAAFALLAATAAAAAWLAVRQDASLLAMTGFAGGYAAPLLIGGEGGAYALFAYYTVLDVGVLAIVAARGWTRLAVMGFVFTFVVTALWRGSRYQPDWFASTEGFLFGYWALFVAMTVLASLRDRARGWLSGTLTFGLPAAVMALQASLVERHEDGLALTSVGLGLAYAALACGCHRAARDRVPLARLAEAFAAIAVVLLTLAVPLRYDAQLTAATWALEGAGAIWLGVVQGRRLLRVFGGGVQLIAGIQLIEALDAASLAAAGPFAAGVPAALLLAAAGAVSAVRLRAAPEPRLPGEGLAPAALVLWSLGFWLWAGLEQLALWLPSERAACGLALAGLTIAALGVAEARLAWRWLAWPARALFAVTAFGGLIAALFDHPFDGAAALGWLLLFAGLASQLARRASEDASDDLPLAATHAMAVIVALLVVALELDWRLGRWPGGDWPRLAWGIVPIALLALLDARRGAPPVAGNGALYRGWIAAGLALAVLAWTAVAGFDTDGSAAPLLPTWPLLNPLDLVALAGLAMVVRCWRRREPADFVVLPVWLSPAVLAVAAFAWANGALVRGLHALAGTPIDADSWAGSPLLQAGFSLLWSTVGLATMRVAAGRAQRALWLCGAGLMVVVALKLFAVDTAGTGTLARIAAFLGVGVILLVAGWLAPMPASRSD
jgi:uncharacterized membrane protein